MKQTVLPKVIVLADDDEDDRMLFEEALLELDEEADLTAVSDGQELIELLSAPENILKPLLIFVDMNMPKMTGFQCLKEIRKTEHLKKIPVVVYSTSCQQETIDEMYKHGARFYICKPNNFKKLKLSIQDVFNHHLENPQSQPSRDNFVIAY